MPATSKSELCTVTEKEFAKLDALIKTVAASLATVKDADDTSIKDVIAHRAHWIALFLGWYHDGQAGKPVFFPAKGYKWNDLKRYNADLRKKQANLDWQGAQALLHTEYTKLNKFLNQRSNTDLYTGTMKGAVSKWTVGRWAEAAGPSHFRSASKYIRQRLKASG